MRKRIYLSHPFGGQEENREKAAALAAFYRAVWDAEGMTDWEIVNPLEYFAPLAADGVDDETILLMAVALMQDCDGVLFAPGWKKSRGCRYEHFKARHADGKRVKYFQAEIPAEVEEAAAHWFGKHHITTRRLAA
jgi:hypothetical protein